MNSNEPDVTQEQRAVRNPEVTYDRTDLSARGVVLFLVVMGIGGIVILASMWGAYRYMAARYGERHQRSVISFEREDPGNKFPAPRLQPDPVADWNAFRWRENEILNAPEGVDPSTGRKHIPIQQAIDEIAAVGLPIQSAETRVKIPQSDTLTQREAK